MADVLQRVADTYSSTLDRISSKFRPQVWLMMGVLVCGHVHLREDNYHKLANADAAHGSLVLCAALFAKRTSQKNGCAAASARMHWPHPLLTWVIRHRSHPWPHSLIFTHPLSHLQPPEPHTCPLVKRVAWHRYLQVVAIAYSAPDGLGCVRVYSFEPKGTDWHWEGTSTYSKFPVLRDSTVKRQDSSKPAKSAASDIRDKSLGFEPGVS